MLVSWDTPHAFLVEDHLLWCAPCTRALAYAEALAAALHALPTLTPPAVIAERLAAARLPWWVRMLQPLQPAWGRLAPATIGVFAFTVLLVAGILHAPTGNQMAVKTPPVPKPHVIATRPAAQSLQPKLPEPRSFTAQTDSSVKPDTQSGSAGQQPPIVSIPATQGPKPASPRNSTPGPFRIAQITHATTQPVKNYAYPAPVVNNRNGAQVPDMDNATNTPVPSDTEYAAYSSHDDVMRSAQEIDLASSEEAQSISPDAGKFAMTPPAEPNKMTPTAMDSVALPTNSNAEINAELRAQLSKHGKAAGSAAVTCVASKSAESGESHQYLTLYPVRSLSPIASAK